MAEVAAALGIAASAVGTASGLISVAQNVHHLSVQFKDRGPQLRLFRRHLEQLVGLLKASARDFERLSTRLEVVDKLQLEAIACDQVKLRIQEGLKLAYDVEESLTRVVDDLRLELKRSIIIQRWNKNKIDKRWEEMSDGRLQLLFVLAPLNAVHQMLAGVDEQTMAANIQHLIVAKEKRIKERGDDQKKLQRKDEGWKKRQAMDLRLDGYVDQSAGTVMKIIRPLLNWASFAVEGSATWTEDQELTVNELLEMVAAMAKVADPGEVDRTVSEPATPHATPVSPRPQRTISDFSGQTRAGWRQVPARTTVQTSAWSNTTPTTDSTMGIPIQPPNREPELDQNQDQDGRRKMTHADDAAEVSPLSEKPQGFHPSPSISSVSTSVYEEKVTTARAQSLAQLQGARGESASNPSEPRVRSQVSADNGGNLSASSLNYFAWLTPTAAAAPAAPAAVPQEHRQQRREPTEPPLSASSSKTHMRSPQLPGSFPLASSTSLPVASPPRTPTETTPIKPKPSIEQKETTPVTPQQRSDTTPVATTPVAATPSAPDLPSSTLATAMQHFTAQAFPFALPLFRTLLQQRQSSPNPDPDPELTTSPLLRSETLEALYMASAILFSHEAEVVRYGGPADHIRDSTLYSADKSTLKPILLRALALTLLASATEEEDMRAVQEAARRMLGEAEGICKKGFRRAGQLWGAGSEGCRDVGRLLAVVYGLKGEEGLRREWEGVVGEKLEGDGGEWLRGGRMVRNMFAVRFGWT